MAKRRNQAPRLAVKPTAATTPAGAERAPSAAQPDVTPVETLRAADPLPEDAGAEPATMRAQAQPAAPWLTVELLLWGGVLLLAAGVRFFALGGFALTAREADMALSALNWFQGNGMASAGVSPVAAALTGFIFMLFGSSDVTARILQATAGLLPVLLTYRLRDALGRWPALVAALLFALSASYLHASRTANGEIIALAGMYTALTCLWAFATSRRSLDLYVAAGAAAVALASGKTAYTILFICATFALIVLVLRSAKALDLPEVDALFAHLRTAPELLRTAGTTFVIGFLAVATGGLTNSLGLQAAVNVAGGWLAQWTAAPSEPASYYVVLLGAYEALPLIFGLAGLFVYLGRGERGSLFLAWWVALALTFYTVSPNKQPEAMLVILLPLIWTAGRAIGDLLNSLADGFSLQNDGVFMVLGVLTCGIFGINLGSYASDGQANHLIVVAIALGMLILIGTLAGGFAVMYRTVGGVMVEPSGTLGGAGAEQWLLGFRRGVAVLGSVALLALGTLFISQSMNLAFNHGDDPHEPMVSAPSTIEAHGLAPMLADLSSRWEGDPATAQIAADASIGNVLRWYLRDFRSVRYFDTAPATAPEPIVIVPADGPQPGFVNYAGQKLRWRWLAPTQPQGGLGYLRWLMFRGLHDVPASYDIIVYVQMR